MQTKTFFFNENSKKNEIIKLLKDSNQTVNSYVDSITKMMSGNKIGYFQFFVDNTYYKFYIMPKIYHVDEGECKDCHTNKKNFIDFFKHYYRLVSKYNIQNHTNEFGGNISDVGFQSKDKSSFNYTDITDMDDFVAHNYSNALKRLSVFFNKHKKYITANKEFKSQSVKNKLNIKRNLLSVDKSFIHQIKKTPMLYSMLALITIRVLKEFLEKKVVNFSETSKALLLRKEVNQLSNFLIKRFPKNQQIFNIKDLLSRKTSKLFDINSEHKLIYTSLLKLASKEHYYNGDKYDISIHKEEETISLFFQPEKLYEWIVYDELIKSNKFDEVLKDGKDDIKKKYTLIPSTDDKEYSSEPDIVVKIKDKFYPIDAKWKILSNKDSKFDDDIFKLRRDAYVRNVKKGYLIYPRKQDLSLDVDIEYTYSFNENFKFELSIINVV